MTRLLKIIPNKFDNENRDKRELSVVKELGHQVIVIAKGENNTIEEIDGFEVHCRTTRPLGNHRFIVNINRIVSLFTWASYARKLKPDIISGHDLIGLFIGWLSTFFISKNKRPLLVYDSHEFELGRKTNGRKNIRKIRVYLMEKFFLKKTVFNMMVNDSIAEEVQKIYNLKDKPIAIRNIPPYWSIDEEVCKEKRKEICTKFDIPENNFLIMYHGGITRERGIGNLINAVKLTKNTSVIILGYGEEEYINELNELITKIDMEKRVIFLDAVSIKDLWKYVGAVDIGVSIIENACASYYLSLPNKLFENIQSLTPIIGSDFPEIRKVIEEYNIGLCCDPHNISEIANAVNKMKEEKVLYKQFKENLKVAKEELCWENEKTKLIEEYSKAFNLIEGRNANN